MIKPSYERKMKYFDIQTTGGGDIRLKKCSNTDKLTGIGIEALFKAICVHINPDVPSYLNSFKVNRRSVLNYDGLCQSLN